MNRSSSHPPALTVLGKSPNPCQRGSRPSLDSPAGQLKTGVTKDQSTPSAPLSPSLVDVQAGDCSGDPSRPGLPLLSGRPAHHGLYPLLKGRARQHHPPVAAQAPDPDVRAQPDHLPVPPPAWVDLPEPQHVAQSQLQDQASSSSTRARSVRSRAEALLAAVAKSDGSREAYMTALELLLMRLRPDAPSVQT